MYCGVVGNDGKTSVYELKYVCSVDCRQKGFDAVKDTNRNDCCDRYEPVYLLWGEIGATGED